MRPLLHRPVPAVALLAGGFCALFAGLRLLPATAAPGAEGRTPRAVGQAAASPLAGSPDLAVSRVSHGGVAGDWQALAVDGSLTASILNRGDAPTGSRFRVTFFSDDDGDQQFSLGTDTVLGQSDVAALDAETTVTVTQRLQGPVRFRDDLVYALADSGAAGGGGGSLARGGVTVALTVRGTEHQPSSVVGPGRTGKDLRVVAWRAMGQGLPTAGASR